MKKNKLEEKIEVFDTTLRDGAQTPGVSFSVGDKLKIVELLDNLGVDYIEGGWPGSNPKDIEFFKEVKHLKLKKSKIVAFGSTRRKNIKPQQDQNLDLILKSGVDVACIFGKTWKLHVEKALQTTLEENINMIYDSIKFLKNNGLEVIYDAEHFFDGYKSDKEYALKCLYIAYEAGADCIVLADTNGGCLPEEVASIVRDVKHFFDSKKISVKLGIHAHNDSDCAVANTIVAVQNGCRHIQGTINGLGERCGNANLCSVIPGLMLKLGYKVIPKENLRKLTEISLSVYEICNLIPNDRQPYVGASAFAHKGGIHASAVAREKKTYEHIDPKVVGNERKILISELAGKSSLMFKHHGLRLDLSEEHVSKIVKAIKEKEYQGYSYENAESSFVILALKTLNLYKSFFRITGFRVIVEFRPEKNELITEATLKLVVGDKEEHVVAEGDGPVNALDNALRKALIKYYPELKDIKLVDFKVRVINPQAGTAAKVRVNIESMSKDETWSTVGVSENIIEASWEALVDAIEYRLLKRIKNL
ncbi:MAG: citramalate synthase [Endomicrobia bacterium]|nr:citramalate synthase [Endomicrobiia bacterium]MDW8056051.1 citramalate synthase [Elusimicrobiota bacterium]